MSRLLPPSDRVSLEATVGSPAAQGSRTRTAAILAPQNSHAPMSPTKAHETRLRLRFPPEFDFISC